jgi:uncharacterized protein (DUF2249 family)
MKSEIVVDGRWLEPPEPMEHILSALDRLRPGQVIRFLIHREPLPLYPMLKDMGYRHTTHLMADGCYEVVIEPSPRFP